MKRGQITVFIVLGIVIVILASTFIFIRNSAIEEDKGEIVFDSSDPVKVYIENCLESKMDDVIRLVAFQGGHYKANGYSFNKDFDINLSAEIPYYYYDSIDLSTNLTTIESELALGIKDAIEYCVDFSPFTYPVTAEVDRAMVETSINVKSVDSEIELPVEIERQDGITSITGFSVSMPSNIYTLYNAAKEINEEQKKYDNLICLTCIAKVANENDIYLSSFEIEDSDTYATVYSLNDRSQDVDGWVTFSFAHGFVLGKEKDGNVSFGFIEQQLAYADSEFYYDVNVSGAVKFSDNSDLFEIDSVTGVINFTPSKSDLGNWITTIKAKDINNETASRSFLLKVEVPPLRLLEPSPELVAKVGQPFSYTFETNSDEQLQFYSNSDLFELDRMTGRVYFIPTPDDVGEYSFSLIVVDERDNILVKQLEINVVQ